MLRDEAARNVARKRREAGISQAQLAERMREAGLSHWRQNTVSRVENALQAPRPEELDALEAILGPIAPDGVPTVWSLAHHSTRPDPWTKEQLRKAEEGLVMATEAIQALRRRYENRDGERQEAP